MKKITTDEFIKKAIQVHGHFYDYSQTVYVNAREPLVMICPNHGVFRQLPPVHLRGSGCPMCGANKTGGHNSKPRQKITTEQFVEKARHVHGVFYDYSKTEYRGSHEMIIVTCPTHGDFEVKAYQHLQYKCRKCADVANGVRSRTTVEDFIRRATDIHEGMYDYNHVSFTAQHDLIKIKCPVHGIFEQAANDHLKGSGCSVCAAIRRGAKRRGITSVSEEEFIERAKLVHSTRYDYSKTNYTMIRNPVDIICPEHGIFTQLANNHLTGCGCPQCASVLVRSSTPEQEWLDSIGVTERQKYIKLPDGSKVYPDGFDPATNTIYEFFGDYWHGNPLKYHSAKWNTFAKKSMGELYNASMVRIEKLNSFGYTVIVLWESQWKKKEQPLTFIPK